MRSRKVCVSSTPAPSGRNGRSGPRLAGVDEHRPVVRCPGRDKVALVDDVKVAVDPGAIANGVY
jgi:hypothetical protein